VGTEFRLNKNLEQQAQAYFNELFVVNAVPTWSECTLSDIGTIVAGGTPSKSKPEYYAKQEIAWITPKDLAVDKSKFISRGANDISELGFSKSSATKMPAGTVLFSSRAPIGYIAIAQNEVTTNQGFKSVVPNENIGTAYVYFLLKNLLPTIEGMASGSTFKEISGTGMKSVPTIMPDMSTIQRFNIFCEPIFKEQEFTSASTKHFRTRVSCARCHPRRLARKLPAWHCRLPQWSRYAKVSSKGR
jgi:hsdS, type I site-specific deoxyribonuclease